MRSVPSAVSRGLGVLLFFATNVILATESLYNDKQTSSTELVKLEFYILLPTDINTTFLFVSCVINPTFIPFITPTGTFYFFYLRCLTASLQTNLFILHTQVSGGVTLSLHFRSISTSCSCSTHASNASPSNFYLKTWYVLDNYSPS